MAFQTLDFVFTTIVVGDELVTNGAFAADTDWAKGTGWTIAAGVAANDASQGADSDIEQTPTTALVEGYKYQTVFTTSSIANAAATMVIGGTEGTGRTTNATFTEIIVAGSGTNIQIQADATTVVDVDDVSVKAAQGVAQNYKGGPATIQVTAGSFGSGKVSMQVSFDGGGRYVPLKDTSGNALTDLTANAFFNINVGPCLMRTEVNTATVTTGQVALRSMFDVSTGS